MKIKSKSMFNVATRIDHVALEKGLCAFARGEIDKDRFMQLKSEARDFEVIKYGVHEYNLPIYVGKKREINQPLVNQMHALIEAGVIELLDKITLPPSDEQKERAQSAPVVIPVKKPDAKKSVSKSDK